MTLLPRRKDEPTPVPRRKGTAGRAQDSDPLAKAQAAIAEGRDEEAVAWLRKALELSPFRTDIREMLVDALDRIGRAKDAPKPKAVRGATRTRLFREPDYIDGEPSAQIEALHFEEVEPELIDDDVPGEKEMLPAIVKVQRAAIAAGAPASKYGSRRSATRRRKPWFLLLAIPALAGIGAVAVWIARKAPSDEIQPVPYENYENEVPREIDRGGEGEILERAGKYFETNEFALAIEQLSKLPDGDGKNTQLAAAYAMQGEAESKTAEGHHRQGATQLETSSLNDARRSYEKALEYAPRDPGFLTEVGRISYTIGRNQQAENRKGWQENFSKAEKNFSTALEANPALPGALEGLAKLEIAQDNRAAAEKYYRRILLDAPGSPQAASARKNLAQWGLKP